jgi:hypothetical protein
MTDATLYNDRARASIQALVDGQAPNGVTPAECGPWQETRQALDEAYARGGPAEVRKLFSVLVSKAPDLARLIATTAEGAPTWGGILPFSQVDLPPFPLEIYPDWLRDYCVALTESMQTPPDLAGMLALSILSTACARRIKVEAWPGWAEPVNVYTVVSLAPGNRKSPVFRAMTAPLIHFEQQLTDRTEGEIMRGEAELDVLKDRLEAAKRRASKVDGEHAIKAAFSDVDDINGQIKDLHIPSRPKLIVDDVTPETVASILADQGGRLAILSPEGDIFAIMAGRYTSGQPNLGVYLRGHVGDPIRVDRRSRSEYIKQPALTIGITTQPEVMRAFGANSAFRGQGLLARFFYALPRSTIGTRAAETAPIPDPIRRAYNHRMLSILETYFEDSGNCGGKQASSGDSDIDPLNDDSIFIIYIKISLLAKNRLVDFITWLEPQMGPYGELAHMADWVAKLSGSVLRIAGLLHIAAHNSHNPQNEISDTTMAQAIQLAHYLMAHAEAAYAEIGADPSIESAKQVLRWIIKAGARTFTKRECFQAVKGRNTLKRADDLDQPLGLLCDHGYIREVEQAERPGPGRKPSQQYDVNPAVFRAHNSHNPQNGGASSMEGS